MMILPPPPAWTISLAAALGTHVAAFEVDIDDAIPLLVGHVQKRNHRIDGRVVDQDVNPAEFSDQALEHGIDIFALGDVGSQRQRPSPLFTNLLRDRLGARPTARIIDQHIRAFIGQSQGDMAADAASAASDEGHFVFESHRRYVLVDW